MNVNEAWNLIDKLLSEIKGTRNDHAVITEALRAIQEQINKPGNNEE